jgi:hypothetical protein
LVNFNYQRYVDFFEEASLFFLGHRAETCSEKQTAMCKVTQAIRPKAQALLPESPCTPQSNRFSPHSNKKQPADYGVYQLLPVFNHSLLINLDYLLKVSTM